MIPAQEIARDPGLFHMRIMGTFIDRLGSDIFRSEQVRYETDFFGYTAAIEFARICDRYFEIRRELGGQLPSSERHCKAAEVNIDGELLRAEYHFSEQQGGHVAQWVEGASYWDLKDETKVKLMLFLSEYP